MKAFFTVALLSVALPIGAKPKPKHAKNVILLLADAGGIPTLNGASIYGYDAPLKLYVQSLPYMGLSNTSPANGWVTDSAAGMTAIVTGAKTNNGVISEGSDAVLGKSDGRTLKTILEYAEERHLATGVVTNMPVADATPAACYAHSDDRKKWGEIYLQVFSPRFGDGVDVAFGAGRKQIYKQASDQGQDLDAIAKGHGRTIYSSLEDVPPAEARPLVVSEGKLDVPQATKRALSSLSKSKNGYFLMVEWDAHTDNPETGLSSIVGFDKLVRELAGTVDLSDTLLLFTADHSFDFRVQRGGPGKPLLSGWEEWHKEHQAKGEGKETVRLPYVRVDDSHTGEEVLATGIGPGAEQLHGFFPNTDLFSVMMNAFGWEPDAK